MDLTGRLRALTDVLPTLEAPDADFGHWELPPPRDGVHSLGWFEFGPTAEAWRKAVAQGEWMVGGFDWRNRNVAAGPPHAGRRGQATRRRGQA